MNLELGDWEYHKFGSLDIDVWERKFKNNRAIIDKIRLMFNGCYIEIDFTIKDHKLLSELYFKMSPLNIEFSSIEDCNYYSCIFTIVGGPSQIEKYKNDIDQFFIKLKNLQCFL